MVNIEKRIEEIKNKTGLVLALLFMLLISAGPAVAKTEPGDKKEKAPAEKKKRSAAAKKHKKQDDTTWYYNGSSNSSSAILTATNWSTSTVPSDCSTGGNRPCSIAVAADDQTALQTYFTGKSKSDIMAISPQTRP